MTTSPRTIEADIVKMAGRLEEILFARPTALPHNASKSIKEGNTRDPSGRSGLPRTLIRDMEEAVTYRRTSDGGVVHLENHLSRV